MKTKTIKERHAQELAPHLVLGQTYLPLAYLANPYTPKKNVTGLETLFDPGNEKLKQERFREAALATKWLMENQKINVFSPIIHSHILHKEGMRGDWEFWWKVDTDYIFLSDMFIVLTIDGWKESVGVQAEIKIAKQFDMEVLYLRKLSEGKYQLRKRP